MRMDLIFGNIAIKEIYHLEKFEINMKKKISIKVSLEVEPWDVGMKKTEFEIETNEMKIMKLIKDRKTISKVQISQTVNLKLNEVFKLLEVPFYFQACGNWKLKS